jgi:hypothetical protein
MKILDYFFIFSSQNWKVIHGECNLVIKKDFEVSADFVPKKLFMLLNHRKARLQSVKSAQPTKNAKSSSSRSVCDRHEREREREREININITNNLLHFGRSCLYSQKHSCYWNYRI